MSILVLNISSVFLIINREVQSLTDHVCHNFRKPYNPVVLWWPLCSLRRYIGWIHSLKLISQEGIFGQLQETRPVWSLWHLILGSTRPMFVIWRQYCINALYYKVILSTFMDSQTWEWNVASQKPLGCCQKSCMTWSYWKDNRLDFREGVSDDWVELVQDYIQWRILMLVVLNYGVVLQCQFIYVHSFQHVYLLCQYLSFSYQHQHQYYQ